jgi:hypothetical protein
MTAVWVKENLPEMFFLLRISIGLIENLEAIGEQL